MGSSAKYSALPADDMDNQLHPDSPELPRDSIDDPNREEPAQNDPLLSRSVRYHDDDPAESPSEQAGLVPRFLAWSRNNNKSAAGGRHAGRRCWWWPSLKTKEQRRTWFLRLSFGSMAVTIIALIIALAVVASRPRRVHYISYDRYQSTTQLPHVNRTVSSRSYFLNFPDTYPRVKTSSPQCQSAWGAVKDVRCHEKIWNRSWDNGTQLSLFEPQINTYVDAICSSTCMTQISKALQDVSAACSKEDVFVKDDYRGPFMADPELEDGPIAALETIHRRLQHTCRLDSTSHYSGNYCPAILYVDWNIVDGMNAGGFTGLDAFERLTSTRRSAPHDYSYYTYRLSGPSYCDSINSATYRSSADIPKRYGPGAGETTCGWCMLNWFERRMLSWGQNKYTDPETGKPIELPDYLRHISRLGKRCETDQWNNIYRRTIAKYKDYGLLPPDWKDAETSA